MPPRTSPSTVAVGLVSSASTAHFPTSGASLSQTHQNNQIESIIHRFLPRGTAKHIGEHLLFTAHHARAAHIANVIQEIINALSGGVSGAPRILLHYKKSSPARHPTGSPSELLNSGTYSQPVECGHNIAQITYYPPPIFQSASGCGPKSCVL